MRLKPSCSWCKEREKFIENTQLRILLQCYKRLCDFMISSRLGNKWGDLHCGGTSGTPLGTTANNNAVNGPNNFAELLEEGANVTDTFNFNEPMKGYRTTSNATGLTNTTTLSVPSVSIVSNGDSNSTSSQSSFVNGVTISTTNSDSLATKSVSEVVTIPVQSTSIIRIAGISSEQNLLPNGPATLINSVSNSSKVKPKRRGCRCGLATPNPGKFFSRFRLG